MSILSDRSIEWFTNSEQIDIYPFDPDMVQPVSYDVHLGHHIQIPNLPELGAPPCIDVAAGIPDDLFTPFDIPPRGSYRIDPGNFLLGHTMEHVTLGNVVAAHLEGKSTIGRLGLLVHVTAGLIDPGFDGKITVELKNDGPFSLRLRPGMAIGQLVFSHVDQAVRRPYGSIGLGSHYQGQTGATAPTGNLMKLENPE